MARLEWGRTGTREFETGVDRGVLYLDGQVGVPWTGLTSVDVSPDGGGSKSYYIDGEKYLLVSQREEFAATINAFTYPPQFAECDGTKSIRSGLLLKQQRRKSFGFSWRSLVGNDLNPETGYKIHLVYGAMADPSDRTHESATDSVDPTPFSWSIKTKPPVVQGYKRTAHVIIDSSSTEVAVLKAVEDVLYGSDTTDPRLPTVSELVEYYDQLFDLVVVDNGDGTFTATGPSSVIQILNEEIWQVTSPNAVNVDDTIFTLTSA